MDPSSRYAVILTRPEIAEPLVLGKALAAARKTPLQDQMPAAKGAWGIVAENLDEAHAENLVNELRKSSVECSVILESSLVSIPAAQPLGRIDPATLEQPFLIAAAGVTVTSTTTRTIKEGPTAGQKMLNTAILLGTGLPIKLGGKERTIEKKQTTSDCIYYLDLIFNEPLRHLRVDAQHFDYSFLKERKLYQVFGNFKLLVEDMVRAAPAALRNHGTKVLLEGKPIQTMGYDSLEDLDREIRWLLTLQKRA